MEISDDVRKEMKSDNSKAAMALIEVMMASLKHCDEMKQISGMLKEPGKVTQEDFPAEIKELITLMVKQYKKQVDELEEILARNFGD